MRLSTAYRAFTASREHDTHGRFIMLNAKIAASSLLFAALILAAPSAQAAPTTEAFRLRLPVVDMPYDFAYGYRAPSMEQALSLSVDAYEVTVDLCGRLAGRVGKKRRWLEELVGYGCTDASIPFSVFLPPFSNWAHEEAHRAVLGRYGIDSKNGVYAFDISSTVAVNGVRDEDLIWLKAHHPADMVRLHMAGAEIQNLIGVRLVDDAFFFGKTSAHLGPVAFSARRQAPISFFLWFHQLLYFAASSSGAFDADINTLGAKEKTVKDRDFSGPDYTAWARDMFRPDEPYAARGAHPSGVGIQRYVRSSDLTRDERDFLSTQTALHFVNLIDPAMFGIQGFDISSSTRFSAALSHQLAPFGYDMGAILRLRTHGVRVAARLHDYVRSEGWLPGIEARIVEHAVRVGNVSLYVTPRVGAFVQPEGLAFRGARAKPGGYVGVGLDVPIVPWLRWSFNMMAKSAGWVQGVEYMNAAVTANVGAAIVVPD